MYEEGEAKVEEDVVREVGTTRVRSNFAVLIALLVLKSCFSVQYDDPNSPRYIQT